MKTLIFHGYLLGGTGSNIYNLNLARAMSKAGHQVHLLCQDPEPERHGFVDAVYSWKQGKLTCTSGEPPNGAGCVVYRPDIEGLLPVYVHDDYPGFEVKTFLELSAKELDRYVELNVAAVQDVVRVTQVDTALANHLVAGPLILKRALEGSGTPYLVKVHGSALEYTVADSGRYQSVARSGLSQAQSVLVGSTHIAKRVVDVLGPDGWPADQLHTAPPGVDIDIFKPLQGSAAKQAAIDLLVSELSTAATAVAEEEVSTFTRDTGSAANALADISCNKDRLIGYVGKLIPQKGVDLLITAFPLVLSSEPEAKLVITGFGSFERDLHALADSLAAGTLEGVKRLIDSGSGDLKFSYLEAFLKQLEADGRVKQYLEAAKATKDRILFLGRLEHSELTSLLPCLEALAVTSTFPEAFGMVSAEAAACGVVPVCANHSGLAEVASSLAQAVPNQYKNVLSFELDQYAVASLAERVLQVLRVPAEQRSSLRDSLVSYSHKHYSWQAVAGRLSELMGFSRPL